MVSTSVFIIFHPFSQHGNIWLNETALKYIRREGKLTSLVVPPGVENKLTLWHGGSAAAWTFKITPGKCLFQNYFHPLRTNCPEMLNGLCFYLRDKVHSSQRHAEAETQTTTNECHSGRPTSDCNLMQTDAHAGLL